MRAIWSLLATLGFAATAPASVVERVEPPNWWTGFEQRELQLLFSGPDVCEWSARVDYPGVRVARTVRAEHCGYLFVYLDIAPDAEPGTLGIELSAPGREPTTEEYTLYGRRDPPRPAFGAGDAIYLITPDRFANGDPTNDAVEGYGDLPDRNEPYGRHGGDIAGIEAHLDYIAELGFTALWINPLLENAMPRFSYHGYAITDLYAVDPRFGSNESFRALVDAADGRGIKIIMDQVVNHVGSSHPWISEPPSSDWINFGNSFVYGSRARTTNLDPYAAESDIRLNADGWFSAAMPDLNQNNPLLADYLVQNSIWWIEYAGLGGIRQDTYPHNDKHFMAEWSERIMTEYPEFNIVGEEWSANPVVTSYWQAGKVNHDGYRSSLPSVFDFPVQAALLDALTAAEPKQGTVWDPLYEVIGMDFLYPDPNNLVIFADNHDKSRVFTVLGEDMDLFRMAMVFLATMRGIPQLYYGTEILMSNPGTESHGIIRSDFPGGWPGDERNAFEGKGLSPAAAEARETVQRLFNWRKSTSVVQTGRFMHYTPLENTYVYFRYGDSEAVMVVMNRASNPVVLDTKRFAERLHGYSSGSDVLSGAEYELAATLTVPARSVLLLELEQ
jgi:glycosidase